MGMSQDMLRVSFTETLIKVSKMTSYLMVQLQPDTECHLINTQASALTDTFQLK